jgi:hypothetical protein
MPQGAPWGIGEEAATGYAAAWRWSIAPWRGQTSCGFYDRIHHSGSGSLRRVLAFSDRPGRETRSFCTSGPYVCVLRNTSRKRLSPGLFDLLLRGVIFGLFHGIHCNLPYVWILLFVRVLIVVYGAA